MTQSRLIDFAADLELFLGDFYAVLLDDLNRFRSTPDG